jgi:L-ascorbate metabolism protein UlaG (beta-lactamase superfamily)
VHFDYRATISANGHTIVETDHWTLAFYSDGTARIIGNSVHIQGPGAGLVQQDAGQVIFNADGSITIHGPHPQFEGQTFCFALLP